MFDQRPCVTKVFDTNGFTPDTNGFTPDTNGFTPDTNGFTPDTNGFTPDTNGFTQSQSGSGRVVGKPTVCQGCSAACCGELHFQSLEKGVTQKRHLCPVL